MRAVVYEDVRELRVEEVPDARLEDPRDALIRVTASAICGSDLHFYHGKAPLAPGEGIGHEAIGVVERVGEEVRGVSPGQRVVPSFTVSCGDCWFCLSGETALCDDLMVFGAGTFGGGLGGAQAELLRVPFADVNLLPVPDELTDEQAVFLGDSLTTGYYGAAIAGIEADDTVAVVGAGPVGFFCLQAARAFGAREVLALDVLPDRLALAEGAGAVPIDVASRNAAMAVAERTGDRGADAAVEAVGSTEAFETAVDVVRRGGTVCVLGVYAGESVEVSLGSWWTRALRLRFAGMCPIQSWWERALEAVLSGAIDPVPAVSHVLPLEDARSGYELFDSGKAMKVLLKP